MNIEYFFKKLCKGTDVIILGKADDYDRKILQDNLDLLAKEMHMAVELQATIKQKEIEEEIKHDKIFIDTPWETMKKHLKDIENGR